MKKLTVGAAVLLLILAVLPTGVWAAQLLIPGGELIGLRLADDRVTVAAIDDQLGSQARHAGLQVGDRLLRIDGKTIASTGDVRRALDQADGQVELTVERAGREESLLLTPAVTPAGPKLGVYLREGVNGVGTVTWYDPESGAFGALGHGVSTQGGRLLEMRSGTAAEARLLWVKQGTAGTPGQLMGALGEAKGSLTKNTPQGVFGVLKQPESGEPLPVSDSTSVHPGPAAIRCTVTEEGCREYSVEILKIYPATQSAGRNLLLQITDPQLLQTTGGIVQGMSGSPIIQDGKLVGAVTHVLVNDPTRGYGIFIENMLEAAG